jgi:Zn finger protein HypA/HybF involved in hydrogenase expression
VNGIDLHTIISDCVTAGYNHAKRCIPVSTNEEFPVQAEPGTNHNKIENKDIWYCEECGSTDVEIKAWTYPNDDDKPSGGDIDRGDCWCNDCENHNRLELTTVSKYPEILKEIQAQKNVEAGIALDKEKSTEEANPKPQYRCVLCHSTDVKMKMRENPKFPVKSFDPSEDEDDIKNCWGNRCEPHVDEY